MILMALAAMYVLFHVVLLVIAIVRKIFESAFDSKASRNSVQSVRQMPHEDRASGLPIGTPDGAAPTADSHADVHVGSSEQLKRLTSLRDSGALDADEFERLKAMLRR
ncbi:MAG: SHOCT domain-containing protein [Solirubrobacteraceae bacterium]